MTATFAFDVFLSHNSQDKPHVERLASRLTGEAKLRPFLDKWHLIPGEPWQPELEQALADSATVAVFFGPSGNAPWHHEEMQFALMRAVREKTEFRVIPVVLPGADTNAIPAFLQRRTWVDFRDGINSEIAFKRLVAGVLGQATEFEGIKLPDEPAPYRGLLHFDVDHARFFFGREKEIGPTKGGQNLVDKLRGNRFVAVVGSSGSGKSSIVRAGLLPKLADDAIPGSREWRTITFTPGENPFRSLANALVGTRPESERILIAAQLLKEFEDPETGLRPTLETWFADSSAPILLFVDQFEELFTHAPSEQSDRAARVTYDGRTQRFVRQLADAVLRPGGRFRAVITLRADFLQHCLRVPELKDLLQDRQLLLGDLAEDEAALREVIQRPAQEVGAMLEKGLMEVLLADVRSQPGALPLLEDALFELWRARRGPWLTLTAYQTSGGVSGALEKRAEDIFRERLTIQQQRIARRIFVKLTSLEEDTKDARRRVDLSSLYAATAEIKEIQSVISILAGPESRLITVDGNSVSMANEALIRNWSRLRTWLIEDRQLERIHRELERAARDWHAHARSKRHLFHATSAKFAQTEEQSHALADRITPLEREFLTACRQERDAENRRLRRRFHIAVTITSFALLMLIVAVIAGIWARRAQVASEEARQGMENALVNSFYRTIGAPPSDRNNIPHNEVEAMWELATLRSENTGVRTRLLEKWFSDEDSINRAFVWDRYALRAAGELNPVTGKQIETLSASLVMRMATTLNQKPDWPKQQESLRTIAKLVAYLDNMGATRLSKELTTQAKSNIQLADDVSQALADHLQPSDAAQLAEALITLIDQASQPELNVENVGTLSWSLAKLLHRLTASEAANRSAESAKIVIRALEATENKSDADVSSLCYALVAVAGWLDPPNARQFAVRLINLMEQTKEPKLYQIAHLGRALAALVKKVDPENATKSAVVGANHLVNAIEDAGIDDSTLINSLAELSAQLRPEDAAALADELFVASTKRTGDFDPTDLSKSLSKVVKRIEPATASSLADRIVAAMVDEGDVYRLCGLADSLAIVGERVELSAARPRLDRAAERLLAEMGQKTDGHALLCLSNSLSALIKRLDPTDAALKAERGADRLADVSEPDMDVDQLCKLSDSLAALAVRLKRTDAAERSSAVATRLVETLINKTDSGSLADLSQSLAKLSMLLRSEKARSLLVMALAQKKNSNTEWNSGLGGSLALLADQLKESDAVPLAEQLINAVANERDSLSNKEMSAILLALLSRIESAKANQARLFAISFCLIHGVPGPAGEGSEEYPSRKRFISVLQPLTTDELVGVLKWPFCVGEAEKLVLAELELKLSAEFGGDVRKFVEQAPSLGITTLGTPAERPRLVEALAELRAIRQSVVDR